MSMSDPVGDLLTRIRNAQRVGHVTCLAPASRLKAGVLEALQRQGYIRGFKKEEVRPGISNLRIELKYSEGQPAIREVRRVSKPGRRVYFAIKKLPRVRAGLGVSILSTPKGVLSDVEARAQNVGGEVICQVF